MISVVLIRQKRMWLGNELPSRSNWHSCGRHKIAEMAPLFCRNDAIEGSSMKKSLWIIICSMFAGLSLLVASSVEADQVHFQDLGMVTRDLHEGGLEWLDLTETTGWSINAITPELEAGGLFEGWRFATLDEIETLWLNFGAVPPFEGWNVLNEGLADSFVALFGDTHRGMGDTNGTFGVTNTLAVDSPFPDRVYTSTVADFRNITTDGDWFKLKGRNFWTRDDANDRWGVWLARDPQTGGPVGTASVPEPNSLVMFLIGLVGIALMIWTSSYRSSVGPLNKNLLRGMDL